MGAVEEEEGALPFIPMLSFCSDVLVSLSLSAVLIRGPNQRLPFSGQREGGLNVSLMKCFDVSKGGGGGGRRRRGAWPYLLLPLML